MRIPDPTFLGQYEHEPPDQPNTMGFGVSFPLPLWNRNQGRIAETQASQQRATANVEALDLTIATQVREAQARVLVVQRHERDRGGEGFQPGGW